MTGIFYSFDLRDFWRLVDLGVALVYLLGGYLVTHVGRLPVRGEVISGPGHYEIEVLDADPRRVKRLRIRLRKDFDVAGFTPEAQTILKALKTYGMFVADNGLDWAISVAPDPRLPSFHEELRKIKGSDFEVVQPPQ